MWRYGLYALLLLAGSARGGEVLHADLEYKDERYFVSFEIYIDAPQQRVYELLTDYPHLTRINTEAIRQSELYYSLDKHTHRVRVVIEACVSYFCKEMTQVQDVEELDRGLVITTVDPEKSDFVYAHSRWKITPEQSGTRVSFDSDFKPAFWVPPVIGPLLIKNRMSEILLDTINGVETLARQPGSQ